MTRTPTLSLAHALLVLAEDIESEDGVANSVCAQSALRLRQLQEDISAVAGVISMAAGKASRRTKQGKEFRAVCNRLIAEVIA